MTKPIRLYYHDGLYFRRSPYKTLQNLIKYRSFHLPIYNAGDQFSPLLIRHLTGERVQYTAPFSRRKLIGLGSGLAAAKSGDVVWGAGLSRAEHVRYLDKTGSFSILAVRGPETRRALLAEGIACPAVYGDPGLLAPMVFPHEPRPRFALGVVPEHPRIGEFRRRNLGPETTFIPPSLPVEQFIAQLCSCALVVTSSLHALIFADAYGIPAVPFVHQPNTGLGFDFVDYLASTHRSPVFVPDSEPFDIQEVARAAQELGQPHIDVQPLLAAFPYSIVAQRARSDGAVPHPTAATTSL